MSKKLFGKGGIIDNETRRWDKQADQVTRNGDSALASLFGMPDGVKPSHAIKPESDHHKEAVKFFQGKETTSQPVPPAIVNLFGSSPTPKVDETTPVVVQTPVVRDTTSSSSKDDTSHSVSGTTAQVEPAKIPSSTVIKAETTSGDKDSKSVDETATKTPLDETPTTPVTDSTVSEKSVTADNSASNNNEAKILEWAGILLNHKQLTPGDKIGLPYVIKTAEAVESLTHKIFELASAEQNSSYITVATNLVAEIDHFYAGDSLLG